MGINSRQIPLNTQKTYKNAELNRSRVSRHQLKTDMQMTSGEEWRTILQCIDLISKRKKATRAND